MTLRVFGLTGGIGSGKSTVGRHFAERGVPVVSADELARAVVAKGSDAFSEIVRDFGADVVGADGELERKELARQIFADSRARERLEAITHPRIRELARARFEALAERGEPLACYEVPLLFEVGLDTIYRPIIVVSAPEDAQLERAARRDGVRVEAVRARIASQLPLSQKVKRADYVIDNSGSIAQTLTDADRVLDALCREFSLDPARYPRPS